MDHSARVTSKHQATIPKQTRAHLHLESGDQVLYELLPNDTVVLRKEFILDLEYLQLLNSTQDEWKSDDDEYAYKKL